MKYQIFNISNHKSKSACRLASHHHGCNACLCLFCICDRNIIKCKTLYLLLWKTIDVRTTIMCIVAYNIAKLNRFNLWCAFINWKRLFCSNILCTAIWVAEIKAVYYKWCLYTF